MCCAGVCRDGATIFVNRGWVLRDVQQNAPMPYDKPNWAAVTGVVQKLEEVLNVTVACIMLSNTSIFLRADSV